jgi:hypothetical protein
MRNVRFDPRQLDAEKLSNAEKAELRSWLQRARTAAEQAVADYEAIGEPSKETDEIWREHKKWLLRNKFKNKCAYCEKSMSDIPKDAEHWRPKRKITGVQAGEHPGYFWLAYSWRNLLPSCSMCNSYDGKKNQFPIANNHVFRRRLTDHELDQLKCRSEAIESPNQPGVWYLGAEDLDYLEGPLLLHPYVDETPTEHLEFKADGFVEGLTKKGESSIKVFALNREELRFLRSQAEQATEARVLMEIAWAKENGRDPQESLDEAEEIVGRSLDERAPFSAAKLSTLARTIASRRPLAG